MSLDVSQQFSSLIDKSKDILIVFPKDYSIDALSSSLVMQKTLTAKDKNITLVCSDFEKKDYENFLSGTGAVKSSLKNVKKFIISLDLQNIGVEEFSYDVTDDHLKIYITPRKGFFDNSHVSTETGDYAYDLIITIDSPDLEGLGQIYENHRDLFHELPVVNIDNNSSNENYGQLNIVDVNCSSCAQVIYEYLQDTDSASIDADIATLLLAGIISKTKAFRTASINPKALNVTSDLLTKGARRDEVVAGLYRSKSLSTLKLWGRILARLRFDKDIKLLWSILSYDDFVKSGANKHDVRGVVDELVMTTPDSDIVLILFEDNIDGKSIIQGQLHTNNNMNASELARSFKPVGSKSYTTFVLQDEQLQTAEKRVIDEIRKRINSI